MSEPKGPTYLPCPFCGKAPDPTDRSTLHPTGIYWRNDAEIGCRTYHSHQERREDDGKCWSFNCLIESGGCGAEIHGDTEEAAIAAWNRRPGGGEADALDAKRWRFGAEHGFPHRVRPETTANTIALWTIDVKLKNEKWVLMEPTAEAAIDIAIGEYVKPIDESVCKHGYLTRHCDQCKNGGISPPLEKR